MEKTLPFPRGSTLSDGELVGLDDDSFSHLEGKLFEVPDTVHGTGQTIILRAVKNDSTADITVARTLMAFSTTTANDFGARVSGLAGAGAVCKPMDDAYVVGFTIPDDDIFYVVERGPCDVNSNAGDVAIAAGMAMASAANGVLKSGTCAQATEYCVGTAMEAQTSSSTATQIYVSAGLDRLGT